MHPNTLANEVAMVNALPISQEQKDSIIAQMVMASISVVNVISPTPEQLAANMAALRKAAPGYVAAPGGPNSPQSKAAMKKAAAYKVKDPTDDDKRNPTKYFYDEFTAAGYIDVSAPNGPVERAGAQWAANGQDMKGAVEYVIAHYADGSPVDEPTKPTSDYVKWPDDKVKSTLALWDAATTPESKWYHLSNVEQNALRNRGVGKLAIAQNVGLYQSGPGAGWNSTPLAKFRDNTPWTRVVAPDVADQVWG